MCKGWWTACGDAGLVELLDPGPYVSLRRVTPCADALAFLLHRASRVKVSAKVSTEQGERKGEDGRVSARVRTVGR